MSEHPGGAGAGLEQAAREILVQVASTAPEQWAVLRLDFRGGPVHRWVDGHWTLADGARRHLVPDTRDLYALATEIGALRRWPRTRLELHHLADGPFTLTATRDTSLVRPARGGHGAVLDPDLYLPAPGEDRPDSTAPPAGDPERAADLFRASIDRRAELLGHRAELPPPATPRRIAGIEAALGFPLPADLRALYLIADGSGENDVLDGPRLLSLAELPGAHEYLAYAAPPFDWNCPAWLPFATDDAGNYYAVDLAPAGASRPGQVIELGGDHYEGPAYRADSVTTLLTRCLDLLERGCYEIEDDEPPYLEFTESAEEPDGPPTALTAATTPGTVPATLLHARLTGPAPVLAPLAAAPRLRRVTLAARPADGLGALRGVAVESLTAVVAADDLAPLAGHPHLGVLDLSGDGPSDLAVLRTLPALWWLDLSRCGTLDVAVLGELTGLRHLALTAAHWEALTVLPPGLVSARLADRDATAEQAAAWAARLGLVPGEPYRITGVCRS
ncbi:SMI1/KNR4 family protein [Kitasatospora sp. CB01950]|uniref:SMI1/KNR4 family protein n=1 Tax=Kitasatospora sp. CB01950 TaxID=1703930 RepID=UPI00093E54F2|nr:SMI1/KNR4 family protein [Kitasatospora sp. CB01950]